MCRFVAYLGKPIIAGKLIIKPVNSLLKQSRNALESEELVNGDGFGIGWYDNSIRSEPGLFHSIRPAWNDENLRYQAAMVRTNCLMAHVRAATHGMVSIENCHPFQYKDYLMMQNGSIYDFLGIKRKLVNRLDEEIYQWIRGETDTQYLFGLLLTIMKEQNAGQPISLDEMSICIYQAFSEIEDMKQQAGFTSPSIYNIVLTNGRSMIATKYSTQPSVEQRSLHLATTSECHIDDNGYLNFKKTDTDDRSVIISSEILSQEDEFWEAVPENHCVMVHDNLKVRIRPMP